MRCRLRIHEVASPGPSPGTGAPALEICPDLVLLARVVVVGSKPLVEGISMNPHRFGRSGLVPLILFQSRHDELAFELSYGFVVTQAAIDHFRDESFQLLFHDKLLQMSAT